MVQELEEERVHGPLFGRHHVSGRPPLPFAQHCRLVLRQRGALVLVERGSDELIRRCSVISPVSSERISRSYPDVGLGASAGIAPLELGGTIEDMIRVADEAMVRRYQSRQ